MKVLFLDIDGVLVHHGFKPSNHGVLTEMDPKCVDRINQICKAIDCKVVVHSTWVHVDPPEFIIKKLTEAGFDITNLHSDWVCNDTLDKAASVARWILKHPEVIKYVVIDDERVGDHPQSTVFAGMFQNGIQQHHVRDVVEKLK